MTTLPPIDPVEEIGTITHFIQETFKDQEFKKAIIAVSGGIDSATTLALTANTLNPKNVYALRLPAKKTTQQALERAQLAIDHANIPENNQLTIHIGSIIQKTWRIIKHYTKNQTAPEKGTPDRTPQIKQLAQKNQLRLGNVAARTRMTVLYDQAKRHQALVLGTENRSEHILGYYTRFGDEAADVEPIKHLYKTYLYEIAYHLGLPKEIIQATPSAGLWSGQTDQKELGFSYQAADPILYLIEQGKSPEEIINAGHDKETIKKVTKQIHATHFKHTTPYSLL